MPALVLCKGEVTIRDRSTQPLGDAAFHARKQVLPGSCPAGRRVIFCVPLPGIKTPREAGDPHRYRVLMTSSVVPLTAFTTTSRLPRRLGHPLGQMFISDIGATHVAHRGNRTWIPCIEARHGRAVLIATVSARRGAHNAKTVYICCIECKNSLWRSSMT